MRKIWTTRQFIKLLHQNGYARKRTTGGHLIYQNADGNSISFTYHNLNRMIAKRLIKENNLKEVV